MIIEITDDLSWLHLYAQTQEQANILGSAHPSAEPLKVWSCPDPVLLTDTARISELRPGLRDAVFTLYQTYPRVVRYDGIEVAWSPNEYPRVWCPSIDTVFFAKNLKPYLADATSTAEIGTGSGFLTKFCIHHGTLKRAFASDINLDAVRCASHTIEELEHGVSVSLVCPNADDETVGFTGAFDILLCNPPYIPRPGERNDNPYEGLDLVAKLASQGSDLLSDNGVMLLNLSSLSSDAPFEWLDDNGWEVVEKDRLRVPLKINAVTSAVTDDSRLWLDYLTGRGLVPAPQQQSGYDYWHDLRFLECRRK